MKRLFKMAGTGYPVLGMALVVAASAGTVTAQELNTLSKKEKKQGWTLLFDGETTNGWHTYLKDEAGAAWTVSEGALAFDPEAGEGGDLVTDGEYENYELSLEWKISEGGNSGVIFNVHEDPEYGATYVTGPEMQVLDNEKAHDNKEDDHLAGSLYDMVAVGRDVANPAGEWNQARLRLKDAHLTLWLNGTKTADVTIGSEEWKELLAASKFKDWEHFATYLKGRIALQDHGNKVWYRNIKIREL
ncbi:3-keto-disaccharide hydrolase [Anseongella ginsenosidimutans]|nr:DUF1080 domain-containing protein [Anseongella ginsenosidimutans]